MTVLITLTVAGTDSGPYNLYSNLDGYVTPFETGVTKASLLSGYSSSLVPDYTSIIKVKSTGICIESINITLTNTTTTTTSTTSTTTTTTTTILVNANINEGNFFFSFELACAAPLNTYIYTNGVEYYYDPGFTSPVYSNTDFFKYDDGFTSNALRTDFNGEPTSAVPCNP